MHHRSFHPQFPRPIEYTTYSGMCSAYQPLQTTLHPPPSIPQTHPNPHPTAASKCSTCVYIKQPAIPALHSTTATFSRSKAHHETRPHAPPPPPSSLHQPPPPPSSPSSTTTATPPPAPAQKASPTPPQNNASTSTGRTYPPTSASTLPSTPPAPTPTHQHSQSAYISMFKYANCKLHNTPAGAKKELQQNFGTVPDPEKKKETPGVYGLKVSLWV